MLRGCRVLQGVAGCCRMLQCVKSRFVKSATSNMCWYISAVAVCCRVLQSVVGCCRVLPYDARRCRVLVQVCCICYSRICLYVIMCCCMLQ